MEKNSEKFHNRLFRNDGNWKFTDVTSQAGLAGAGYSMLGITREARCRKPTAFAGSPSRR